MNQQERATGRSTSPREVAAYNLSSPFKKQHGFGATPAEVLNRNGYLEIRPATNFGGPGTIVTVDLKTDNFVMMHPTCNMDGTEVSSLWQILSAWTPTSPASSAESSNSA
jgi:hypothetical protein